MRGVAVHITKDMYRPEGAEGVGHPLPDGDHHAAIAQTMRIRSQWEIAALTVVIKCASS